MQHRWVVCADDNFSVKVVQKHFSKFTAELEAKNRNIGSISVRYFVTTPKNARKLHERKRELLRELGGLIQDGAW